MRRTGTLGGYGSTMPMLAALGLIASLALSGCQTAPMAEPVPANRQAMEAPPEQAMPCPDQSDRELEKRAIELLDQGESDEARRLLDCVIDGNPHSRRANILIRQLDADPVAYLGARYYLYTVKSSETLSKIAGERLKEPLEFVILARYNDIPVPANLVAGQRIKIPGKEPRIVEPAPAEPEPETDVTVDETPSADAGPTAGGSQQEELHGKAVALEQQGDLDGAYRLLKEVQAADPQRPGIDDDVARVRQSLVASLEETAYADELAGDVEAAVETWKRLLEIDPRNIPAQLSIRRLTQ